MLHDFTHCPHLRRHVFNEIAISRHVDIRGFSIALLFAAEGVGKPHLYGGGKIHIQPYRIWYGGGKIAFVAPVDSLS